MQGHGGLGLVPGARQVAIRRKVTDDVQAKRQRRRSWEVQGVPRDRDLEFVTELMQEAGFAEVQVRSKVPKGLMTVWAFAPLRVDEKDLVELTTDDDSKMLVIGVSNSRRKTAFRETVELPKERVTTFQAKEEEEKAKDKSDDGDVDMKDSPNEGDKVKTDAGKEGEGGEAAAAGDAEAAKRRPAAGPEGAKKRKKANSIPLGMEIVQNEGKGRCLFLAIAQGLKYLNISQRPTATLLRGKVVSHFKRHLERYRR